MVSKKAKKNINAVSNDRLHFGRAKEEVMFPVAPDKKTVPQSYPSLLSHLKERICQERICQERLRVVLASNAALVILYWDIGQSILKKQSEEGWGAKVIDRLSVDLSKEFPDRYS